MVNNNQFIPSHEHKFINYLNNNLESQYIGDDCALIDNNYLITSDCQIEGTHFSLDYAKPYEIGLRLVYVNISDIAAMGGIPKYIQIMLNIPEKLSQYFLKQLYQGIIDACNKYKIKITGGNIAKSNYNLALSATLIGLKHDLGIATRNHFRPGYDIVVTGDCGLSHTGLWHLNNIGRNLRLNSVIRHLQPIPRLAEAWVLLAMTNAKLALIDTSDSIYETLGHIYQANSYGININIDNLPLNNETVTYAQMANCNPYAWALYGGEDYELLACMEANLYQDINKALKKQNFLIQLNKIGEVTKNNSFDLNESKLLKKDKRSISFEHLK